ncbi:MarR family transcriptional regulator [Candidatus Formimonas warabiya]|uniref:DNA-binding protein n=1 Tax=Formimonas warabiya TaxID=1761012 RepID=A0A3G1L001_FORW1|nr:MarR family transcriptional regulator [Candidatus Formimonas warabiya]ATW28116.1 DNA-binding protein [Candidatus Formimonas warabiya]
MAQLLPLKFRILHYFSKAKGDVSVDDLLKDLKNEYSGDGQFTKSGVSNHLDSLRAVGMIEVTEPVLNNNELTIKYKITDYGTSRLAYLPQEWQSK